MNEQQKALYTFFSEKAKHLQREIDLETERAGGRKMLLNRIDLIHWIDYAESQVETYRTVCRMLEDQAEGADTHKILQDLRETFTADRQEIETVEQKLKEEQKALDRLRKEAEYYQLALETLKA